MKYSIVCLILLGCPKPAPTPAADGSSEAAGDEAGDEGGKKQDDCGRACINLRKLKCPEGDSVDGGDSCEKACRHTQTTGLTDLKPKCIAVAGSQSDLIQCGTVKCKTK